MTTRLVAGTLALLASGLSQAAETPPPVAWARQSLASGHLRPWERQWATRMARGQVGTERRVWVTNYGPWDRGHYKGAPWHIACNSLPVGTVVWMDGRLRVVTNRGAGSNDAWARREGCEFWCDRWTRTRRSDNAAVTVYVVGRAPWPH